MVDISYSQIIYFDNNKLETKLLFTDENIPDIFNIIYEHKLSNKIKLYCAELKTLNSHNQFITEVEKVKMLKENTDVTYNLYLNIYTQKHFNINLFNNFLKNLKYNITCNELNTGIANNDKYYQFILTSVNPQLLSYLYMIVRYYIENEQKILKETSFLKINNILHYDLINIPHTMNLKINSKNIIPNYASYANEMNIMFDNKLYKHVFNMNTIKYNRQLNIENNTYTDNRCNIQCNIFNFLTYELCMINMYNSELNLQLLKTTSQKTVQDIIEYISDMTYNCYDNNNILILDYNVNYNQDITIKQVNNLFEYLKSFSRYNLLYHNEEYISLEELDGLELNKNHTLDKKLEQMEIFHNYINEKITKTYLNDYFLKFLMINIKYDTIIFKVNKGKYSYVLDKFFDITELLLNFNEKIQKEIIKKLEIITIAENINEYNDLIDISILDKIIYKLKNILYEKENNLFSDENYIYEQLIEFIDNIKLVEIKTVEIIGNDYINDENNKNTEEIKTNNEDEFTLINNDSSVNLAKLALQDGDISDDINNKGYFSSLTGWLFKG